MHFYYRGREESENYTLFLFVRQVIYQSHLPTRWIRIGLNLKILHEHLPQLRMIATGSSLLYYWRTSTGAELDLTMYFSHCTRAELLLAGPFTRSTIILVVGDATPYPHQNQQRHPMKLWHISSPLSLCIRPCSSCHLPVAFTIIRNLTHYHISVTCSANFRSLHYSSIALIVSGVMTV